MSDEYYSPSPFVQRPAALLSTAEYQRKKVLAQQLAAKQTQSAQDMQYYQGMRPESTLNTTAAHGAFPGVTRFSTGKGISDLFGSVMSGIERGNLRDLTAQQTEATAATDQERMDVLSKLMQSDPNKLQTSIIGSMVDAPKVTGGREDPSLAVLTQAIQSGNIDRKGALALGSSLGMTPEAAGGLGEAAQAAYDNAAADRNMKTSIFGQGLANKTDVARAAEYMKFLNGARLPNADPKAIGAAMLAREFLPGEIAAVVAQAEATQKTAQDKSTATLAAAETKYNGVEQLQAQRDLSAAARKGLLTEANAPAAIARLNATGVLPEESATIVAHNLEVSKNVVPLASDIAQVAVDKDAEIKAEGVRRNSIVEADKQHEIATRTLNALSSIKPGLEDKDNFGIDQSIAGQFPVLLKRLLTPDNVNKLQAQVGDVIEGLKGMGGSDTDRDVLFLKENSPYSTGFNQPQAIAAYNYAKMVTETLKDASAAKKKWYQDPKHGLNTPAPDFYGDARKIHAADMENAASIVRGTNPTSRKREL